MRLKQIKKSHLFLVGIYALLSYSTQTVAEPPELGPTGSDLSQYIYQDGNQAIVDVQRLRFTDFPPVQSSGQFGRPDGDIFFQWQRGDRFEDLFNLGDLASLGVQNLNVEQIATLSGADPEDIAIAGVKLYARQSVNDLVEAVPGLRDVELGQAQPILELADTYVRSSARDEFGDLSNQTIGEVLGKDPDFGQRQLSELGIERLEQFKTTEIPGLDQTQLEQFSGWTTTQLSDIENLPELPIGAVQPSLTMPVGRHDFTWGPQEKFADYKPITGGDRRGYNQRCDTPRRGGGTGCATVELGDFGGSFGQLGLNGAHFVKGGKADDAMETPGGFGDWRVFNKGQEPVGRPFGEQFKLVLIRTDEETDTADYGLFTRKCRYPPAGPPTCTPKFIGPFPVYSSKPGGAVFLGTPTAESTLATGDNPVTPGSSSSSFSGSSSEFSPFQSGGLLDGEATPILASNTIDDCDSRSLRVVHPNLSDAAAGVLPRIIDEAQKAGLTTNQTAFVLAVAEQRYEYTSTLNPRSLVSEYGGIARQHISDSVVDFRAAVTAADLDPSQGGTLVSAYQAALQPCQRQACNPNGRFIRPTTGLVTSEMGLRLHPIYGTYRLHAGIDIADRAGTAVVAGACGIVEYVGPESGYGTVVVINHGPHHTRSAHLSSTQVTVGQRLNRGDLIGAQGATGNVTGVHLHWEIRAGGRWGTPQNPRQFANF